MVTLRLCTGVRYRICARARYGRYLGAWRVLIGALVYLYARRQKTP